MTKHQIAILYPQMRQAVNLRKHQRRVYMHVCVYLSTAHIHELIEEKVVHNTVKISESFCIDPTLLHCSRYNFQTRD